LNGAGIWLTRCAFFLTSPDCQAVWIATHCLGATFEVTEDNPITALRPSSTGHPVALE